MSHKTLFALALVGAFAFAAERGAAAERSQAHDGSWPIQNGYDRQPTGNDNDVSPDQAREIDQLYDELLSTGDKTQPRPKRAH